MFDKVDSVQPRRLIRCASISQLDRFGVQHDFETIQDAMPQ
jgi:hypothetical protein